MGGHGGTALGYGGIVAVARATGLLPGGSAGASELDVGAPWPADRVRQPGGERKRASTHDPTLLRNLEAVAPFRERVVELRARGVECRAIHQILRDECGFAGAYQSVFRFVRRQIDENS